MPDSLSTRVNRKALDVIVVAEEEALALQALVHVIFAKHNAHAARIVHHLRSFPVVCECACACVCVCVCDVCVQCTKSLRCTPPLSLSV